MLHLKNTQNSIMYPDCLQIAQKKEKKRKKKRVVLLWFCTLLVYASPYPQDTFTNMFSSY